MMPQRRMKTTGTASKAIHDEHLAKRLILRENGEYGDPAQRAFYDDHVARWPRYRDVAETSRRRRARSHMEIDEVRE